MLDSFSLYLVSSFVVVVFGERLSQRSRRLGAYGAWKLHMHVNSVTKLSHTTGKH